MAPTYTASTSGAPSSWLSQTLPIDKNGQPWDPSKNSHLRLLSRQGFSVEYIQTNHYPTFTTSQLTELIAYVQAAKAATSHQAAVLDKMESVKAAQKADNDEDEVIDSGFAQRRGNQPAWQGTTTRWESRGKLGIGWTPVSERPDMGTFLKTFKGLGDGEGKEKGEVKKCS
jgi:hypothetical protein